MKYKFYRDECLKIAGDRAYELRPHKDFKWKELYELLNDWIERIEPTYEEISGVESMKIGGLHPKMEARILNVMLLLSHYYWLIYERKYIRLSPDMLSLFTQVYASIFVDESIEVSFEEFRTLLLLLEEIDDHLFYIDSLRQNEDIVCLRLNN